MRLHSPDGRMKDLALASLYSVFMRLSMAGCKVSGVTQVLSAFVVLIMDRSRTETLKNRMEYISMASFIVCYFFSKI